MSIWKRLFGGASKSAATTNSTPPPPPKTASATKAAIPIRGGASKSAATTNSTPPPPPKTASATKAAIPIRSVDSRALLMDGASSGSIEKVVQALEAGADVNLEIEVLPKPGSLSGLALGGLLAGLPVRKSALKVSIEGGHSNVARLLLQKGAILRSSVDGINPWDGVLIDAAKEDRVEISALALEQGADVNCRGIHQTNPLMMASMFGHQSMVGLLLEKGADFTRWSSDPSLPSRKHRTARMWASSEGHHEVVRILTEAGAKE